MGRRLAVALVVFVALLAGALYLSPSATGTVVAAPHTITPAAQKTAVARSVSWLMSTQQNADGGFGSNFATSEPQSTISTTLDAILAVAAAGENPGAPYAGRDETAVDYLLANTSDMAAFADPSGGSAGKIVMALAAANQNPRDFGGIDWVALLVDQLDPDGTYNTQDAFNQSLALLGLTAVNEPVPPQALAWLKDKQAADGSWDDGFGTLANSDTTALAIMALLAGGTPQGDATVADALAFLQDTQLPSGGWEYGPGYGENANSIALVVQALSTAGEDFSSTDSLWAKDGVAPLAALLSWQSAEGAFQADFGQGPADNLFATVQAVPGATGRPYPLPSRFEVNRQALVCLAALQDVDSGGWEQFAGFGVNAAGTARAIEAIRAAGGDPQAALWQPGSVSALDALAAQAPGYIAGGRGGRPGIVAQGVAAAGAPYDASDFAGLDLPTEIAANLEEDGTYDDTSFGYSAHAEAILGLLASGARVDPTAVTLLLNGAQEGDWGGPDGNGIALNSLGRLGVSMPAGIANLRQTQQEDAGWGFGVPASPSSTSEVVQGLVQQGENPFGPGWSVVVDGRLTNAADTIMAQQQENGCWPNLFGPGDDPFGTTDAMVLLGQKVSWPFHVIYLPLARR